MFWFFPLRDQQLATQNSFKVSFLNLYVYMFMCVPCVCGYPRCSGSSVDGALGDCELSDVGAGD